MGQQYQRRGTAYPQPHDQRGQGNGEGQQAIAQHRQQRLGHGAALQLRQRPWVLGHQHYAEYAGGQHQHHAVAEQVAAHAHAAQQAGQQRRHGQCHRRQHRQQVHLALARAGTEEHQYQYGPAQQQPLAAIATTDAAPPGLEQHRQQQAARQPQGQDHLQVVPGRLPVVPGIGVAGAGLLEQQLVRVGLQFGAGRMQQGPAQRRQPHAHAQQERRDQPQQRCRVRTLHTVPATALVQPPAEPGQHQQQRQETHALGHRADTGGETGQPQRGQVATFAQVPHQAPQGDGGHPHQHHVDLRTLGHQPELQRAEQRREGIDGMPRRPQPPCQIRHQPQTQQGAQQ